MRCRHPNRSKSAVEAHVYRIVRHTKFRYRFRLRRQTWAAPFASMAKELSLSQLTIRRRRSTHQQLLENSFLIGTMARDKKLKNAQPLTTAQRLRLSSSLPRHHAQGQGAQRRPRPAADAHLDHVPEVPGRHGADRASRKRSWPANASARRIEAPYRWRDWAAEADGITGDELISFHQPRRSRPARRHARARACSPTCAACRAPTATTGAT